MLNILLTNDENHYYCVLINDCYKSTYIYKDNRIPISVEMLYYRCIQLFITWFEFKIETFPGKTIYIILFKTTSDDDDWSWTPEVFLSLNMVEKIEKTNNRNPMISEPVNPIIILNVSWLQRTELWINFNYALWR